MANVPDPLVSCIMPAGDRAELLLQSIECFRHQDYRNRELIIVDDSVNGLVTALPGDLRIHYLRVPNGVPSGGKRNFGLHHAQGEILAFWDVESWYGPDRLRRQIQPLLAGEADVTGLQTGFSEDVNGSTLVFQRAVWEQHRDGYPETLSKGDGTAFLKHVLARGARLLAISGEGLLRIAEQPMSVVTSELLVMPSPRGKRPLVSCIMPTANRREFLGRAVRQFLNQDYPNRELLIVDDGEGSAPDLPADSSNIRYFRLGQRSRVGTKRNYACEQARGEIIVHWDDDDWMAPWRLSYQVDELLASGADACGLNRLYFYEPQSRQAWDYIYPPGEPPWLAGGTLCYWKRFWDRNRFPDLQVGEDNSFVWSPAAKRLHAHRDRGFYAALIHSGNTSPKLIVPDRWRPVDFRELERLLESRGRHSIPDEPARIPIAAPPPEPAVFAEHSVAAFTAARAEDLNLIEFRALNHGRDLPRMRRWEIPFAIFQARLSGGMEVLDCTLNPEGFERALAELYPDVRYRHFEPVSDGKLALPAQWQEERFDRVFCINTLEHVPREEREKLIAFIARMLKPGGRLITTLDYYFESSFSRQDWIDRGLVRSDRQEVFGGFNRIPPADLAQMCKRAGLSPLAPIPADPEEGDPSLYLQAAPLEHTTIGAVFSKGIASTPRPSRVLLAMLTWNTLAISRDSVAALVREARMLGRVGVEAGLCVVDNGSDDGTAQAIKELDAAIDVTHRFFLNPQNLGNSHARNQIIGYAQSAGFDYVLFTDGDLEIVPFSAMAMLRYLECSPAEVGCIGAFSAGCSPRRTQSTPVLFSLSGFEIASSDVLAWTQYGMFRRSLFESGIRFDEDGPFGGPGHGFEDVDLVFQMRTRGFASHYFSGITYLHRHISSSVPNLRKGGLDPQKLYAERREHLLSKWKDVRSLEGPLRWVREVQSGYPASDGSGRGSEWSAREASAIVRPDEHPQTCYDVVILPVFPFDFRYQRPQQIAARFAAAGHRVFWIDPSTPASLTGEPYVLRSVRENLWEVRLAAGRQDIYSGELTTPDLRQLRNCLGAFYRDCAIAESCVLVQLPFWRRLALAMRQEFGAKVVYDCMDEWAGFENIGPFNLAEEERLARDCDFLAVSASRLSTRFEGAGLKPALIRNGCDFAFFQNAADEPILPEIPRPVAGYFGAIAEWFDVDLVYQVAKSRPHYSFVLAGQVHGVDVSKLQDLPNVFFPGQFAYQQMPALLREFDACMIPFCLNRLTQATDPVKLYEYLSLGKPVVATRMEELARCGDLIYTADHPEDFARLLDVALAEANAEDAAARIEFASHNDWDQRFAEFDQGIAQCFPAVSIVIVTYNSVEYIGACLRSIQRNTSYPNFEVVVADNCSFDGTAYVVEKFAAEDPRIRLMRLPSNVGFAAATNAAVRESTGSYVAFLNPDTIVTSGWVERLLRPLRLNASIGLVCPTTNFAGNEAKIDFDYRDEAGLDRFAMRIARQRHGQANQVRMIPLFCAMTSREVFDQAGGLDPIFEIGMFEDDDFSMTLKVHGFHTVLAEDCFIHHFGQASFSRLTSREYTELFERNREQFERKWQTPWQSPRLRPNVVAPFSDARFVPKTFCAEPPPHLGAVRLGPECEDVLVPAEVLDWTQQFASGMIDRSHLIALAAAIRLFPWTGKELVVEIGAYVGNTSVFLAKVLQILGCSAIVLSIDPFERCQPDALNPQGSYSRYLETVLSHGFEKQCIPMVAFSEHAAPAVPDRIGVLFVDGSHHYQHVSADLETYSQKVVAGGIIVIHDYFAAYPDVIRAVDEFQARHPEMELLAKDTYVVFKRPAASGTIPAVNRTASSG